MSETPIPPAALKALAEIDSATISNAIELFKVRDPVTGYASLELRCQYPDLKPMVGYAVTCTEDNTTAGDQRPMRMEQLIDVMEAAPKPAILVIKQLGTDRLRSCFTGDMFCTTLQKLGFVGVVTDGGNRDSSGIRSNAPGFQIFSPGWVVSHGYGVFIDFNVTVSVYGLTIQPNDLLHGDESGLLTIPHEIAEDVVAKARGVKEDEAAFFEFLKSDSFTVDGLKAQLRGHSKH